MSTVLVIADGCGPTSAAKTIDRAALGNVKTVAVASVVYSPVRYSGTWASHMTGGLDYKKPLAKSLCSEHTGVLLPGLRSVAFEWTQAAKKIAAEHGPNAASPEPAVSCVEGLSALPGNGGAVYGELAATSRADALLTIRSYYRPLPMPGLISRGKALLNSLIGVGTEQLKCKCSIHSETALWSPEGKKIWQHEFSSVSKRAADCKNLLSTTGLAMRTTEVLIIEDAQIKPLIQELASVHASELLRALRAVAERPN